MKFNNSKHLFLLLPVFAAFLFGGDTVYAQAEQDNTLTDQPKSEKVALDVPDKVDVQPIARDDEISKRLGEILGATKWFNEPTVEVQDGVVFLSGEAVSAEYKVWASDLASKTQDVAAVVNRMTIAPQSIWDFSSAFAELREFRNNAIQAIPLVVFGLGILILTWFLARLAGYVANRTLSKRVPNSLLRWMLTRAAMLPVLIFGIYLILRISGLTQLALTVLGGTGLIGLVIGIAFQDIAENFLASILISVQKPFRIGDLIRIVDHEGIVQRVTTRGTTLLTVDGNHVQIPNSRMYKETIENYTANPHRRVSFDIGIGYDDSTSEAQTVVLEKVKQHTATLTDPPPKVLIDNLGASTVNLTALFWIDGTKSDYRSVRSSCMRISKQALMSNGVSLPDEAREVIFPDGVPVMMNQQTGSTEAAEFSSGSSEVSEKVHTQLEEQPESEAEGKMQSESADLKRQADQSWLPGEGEEILVG